MKYILASASPRRRELLKQIGIDFTVVTCDTDESCGDDLSPAEAVEELSRRKAYAVYNKTAADIARPTAVIAADTVVAFENKILGKPADEENAARMLTMLSGNKHTVYTGVTVILHTDTVRAETFYDMANVYFRRFDTAEIAAYIATGEPMDKAGAYGIQGYGAVLAEKIEGDYYTIVGLPLTKLYVTLKKLGALRSPNSFNI